MENIEDKNVINDNKSVAKFINLPPISKDKDENKISHKAKSKRNEAEELIAMSSTEIVKSILDMARYSQKESTRLDACKMLLDRIISTKVENTNKNPFEDWNRKQLEEFINGQKSIDDIIKEINSKNTNNVN